MDAIKDVLHYGKPHKAYNRDDFVLMLLSSNNITPYFQPIFDLYNCEVFGYEVLSRGKGIYYKPDVMFSLAAKWNLTWSLERICRINAITAITKFPKQVQNKHFFLNVSPNIFSDHRFKSGFTMENLAKFGIDRRKIVLEITETTSVSNYNKFKDIIEHYIQQGFNIALDDFGVGHSGLVTMIAASPKFIKLDRALISNINEDSYRQHLVKAIVRFAESVESNVIAEGIETEEELATAYRLGVRYAQGFFIARPSAKLPVISVEKENIIRKLRSKFRLQTISLDTSITSLVLLPITYQSNSVKTESMAKFFRKEQYKDHVVLLDGDKPSGLITRERFNNATGGPFGYDLMKKEYVDSMAKKNPLVVAEDVDIPTLGNIILNRDNDDLYDPVIVVNGKGKFVGTVTVRTLFKHALDIEVKIAANSNPLTLLPGNVIIQKWIEEYTQQPPFTVVYADLDRFKEYNDSYGFTQGDNIIKLAGTILSKHIKKLGSHAHLGHLGGDDFIGVIKGEVSESTLAKICKEFDYEKLRHFNDFHQKQGYFIAKDRQGNKTKVKLVTLSLSVITSSSAKPFDHPAKLGQIAASLKKKIKQRTAESGTSDFLIDRRRPDEKILY